MAALCWAATPAFAAENSETERPDLALLEFIGQWETDAGEWAPPSQFEDDTLDELLSPPPAPRAGDDEPDAGNDTND